MGCGFSVKESENDQKLREILMKMKIMFFMEELKMIIKKLC